MTLNRVKLVRLVTFMKPLSSVVFLIILLKTLISKKITFRISKSNVVKGLAKSILRKHYQYSIFLFPSDLSLLAVKISIPYN